MAQKEEECDSDGKVDCSGRLTVNAMHGLQQPHAFGQQYDGGKEEGQEQDRIWRPKHERESERSHATPDMNDFTGKFGPCR
jgi:hypothetical protein